MPSSPPTLPPVADGTVAMRLTRRVRAKREADGRRLGSAGGAVAVCALALAIAAVLNAPGAHKKAYNLDDGWKRDVALAITGPLATASHALLLDRPRVGLQTVAGRSGADDIDTQFGSPAPAPVVAPPKPALPQKYTPTRPLRLWIAGTRSPSSLATRSCRRLRPTRPSSPSPVSTDASPPD